MRFSSDAFSRYRPRALTLAVLLVVVATLVLANLSFDRNSEDWFAAKSYGWPLIWHRYVSVHQTGIGTSTVGWYPSAGRLAVNLTIWVAMLLAATGGCEWLLRRFRPRMRWSLRAMLIAVGLVAALCGWFAAARRWANLQDQIIAEIPSRLPGLVKMERWGPKWLDLIGADRFRRDIVLYGNPGLSFTADEDGERRLRQLAQSPKLRQLLFATDHVTPGMADVMLVGDCDVLVAGLGSLPALEHLKTLHLGGSQSLNLLTRYARLALDRGYRLHVPEDDLDRFRRALEALRQARPGIVIDGNLTTPHWKRGRMQRGV
jgi:hypothetical protein